MNTATVLNTAWMWKCRREWRRFRRATSRVAHTQATLLADIMRRNRNCDYGVQNGFQSIDTPAAFQDRVPLSNYETYVEQIGRICAGQPDVLTCEPIRILEPTSGSTGAEKLIPYTDGLRQQFQRGISAWIGDLFHQCPSVRRGRAYWSISPAFGQQRRSAGGVPIGFDEDTAYLGAWERRIINRLLAVPASVAKLQDIDAFRYQTLLHLLAADDLTLISVWSPTFLTALLTSLAHWQDRLVGDVRNGVCGLPPNAFRARILNQILSSEQTLAEKLREIWPRLALVSCWADATAAMTLPEARRLLPDVEFQPKGLLSTEAFVSFPLVGQCGAALAIRSHFFEFEEVASNPASSSITQSIRLAYQLELGKRYRVIVTTAGGLYRYQLYDEVVITGFIDRCPLLRFEGKSNTVSDVVGEKLSEPHVRRTLEHTLATLDLCPAFAMLAPATGPPHYRLYLQFGVPPERPIDVDRLTTAVQRGLEENPHYRLACRLGQLAPVELQMIPHSQPSAWAAFEHRRVAEGQKPGDVKPVALSSWAGWAQVFPCSPGDRRVRRDNLV